MVDRATQALMLLAPSWGVLFQVVGLLVQTFGLLGLVWYAVETRRMRKAAEAQVRVSQALYAAGLNQEEAHSRPCVTLLSEYRNATEAIIQQYGAVGSSQAGDQQRSFAFQNIGNGVAFKISYKFQDIGPTPGDHWLLDRYIPYVRPGDTERLVESRTSYPGRCSLVLKYESISGRKYQTTIELHQHVIIDFVFTELHS